jgi:hypothetical protein
MKTYVFMYILTEDIDAIQKCLGLHISYWKGLSLEYYKNGPFADKSGGLIIFSAGDAKRAEDILQNDPLITEKAVVNYWLKEWVA